MKNRILGWSIAGVAVALGWALYAFAAGPETNIAANPVLWTLAQWTCPIVLAGTYFHFGVRLEWVVLANAAIYALLGATFTIVRRIVVQAK